MKKIDIKVKKSAKGDYLEGDFFIKALSFNELVALQEKLGGDGGEARMVQACLVDANGDNVFKAQQINIIGDRMIGGDMVMCVMDAMHINRIGKIGELAESYSKNSESDQA